MSDKVNYAELSDEELMNIDDTEFSVVDENKENSGNEPTEKVKDDKNEEVVEELQKAIETPQEEEEEKVKTNTEVEEVEENIEEEEEEPKVEDKEDKDKEDDVVVEALAPLKANGKELKLNSIEELRNLASMGANYSLKMQKIKPHLKLLKTLDKYDLLDEDKINHLIALTKGDKSAISKLLKESDIDPEYLDITDSEDYKAKNYVIPENELALDEVLDEIKTSEYYPTTMDILGNQWDEASRKIVASNPQAVKTIHSQVENGMFSKIWEEVERQRILGNLGSMSDVEAYNAVGQAMQEQGAFNPTKDSGSNAKRKARRKSAGMTKNLGKPKAKTKSLDDYDIMRMSDEEIEALTVPGIL